MKMNKKLMIPLFATVLGLSVVGSIGGAVAWYQFNSRVSASFVGVSSADSGVLQISNSKDSGYGRDVYGTNSKRSNRLTPVTFGFGDEEAGRSAALPQNAYCYPEAGKKNMTDWTLARANYEYLQFDLYLKAQGTNADGDAVAALEKEVYLSEMFLDSQVDNKPEIARALRVHLAVYDDATDSTKVTRKFLISKEGAKIDMHGYLDLDGNGSLDRDHGYAWASNTNKLIDYGEGMKSQSSWAIETAKSLEDIANGDDSDANYILAPRYNPNDFVADESTGLRDGDLFNKSSDNLICKTLASRPVQIKVTVWLEGWALLESNTSYKVAATQPADQDAIDAGDYYVMNSAQSGFVAATDYDANVTYYEIVPESALWNVSETGEVGIQVGMQFDVGKNAFRPAN